MRKTKYVTFCALMAALSVVILWLGSLLDIFDITAVIVTSFFVLIAREEMGYKSIAIYVVTALIALFIIPNKLVAIEYAIISIYPVFKPLIDKQQVIVKWLIRLVYDLAAALTIVLVMKIFTPDSPMYWDIIFACGFILIFFLYDILLFRFIMYYRFKLRNKLRIDKFFNQN
ncbi:MAG: hypothetical protein IJX02_01735 [Clostridia bacterium]|nr:hypothetical protein [Clostridia bacterium]